MQRIHSSFPTGNNLSSLSILLQTTRGFSCTDARDHVLSLLGLASDRNAFRQLRPDYTSPAGATHHMYALCCVKEKKNLSFLSLGCEYGSNPEITSPEITSPKMPSWVPDLARPTNDASFARELLWFRATCICHARGPQSAPPELPKTLSDEDTALAGITRVFHEVNERLRDFKANREPFPVTENLACQAPLQASLSGDDRVLTLRGAFLDRIAAVGSPFIEFVWIDAFRHDFPKRAKEFLALGPSRAAAPTIINRFQWYAVADWLRECQDLASDRGNGRLSAARLEQLCRTLLWDIPAPDGRKSLSVDRCAMFAQYMLATEKRVLHEREQWWMDKFRALDAKFTSEVGVVFMGRRFCVTERGHIGSVPAGAEAGDKICLFYGGSMPYVIRPCGSGQHSFIGDCYLHSFMMGEGMDRESEDFPLV
jgi:hypothetical protein